MSAAVSAERTPTPWRAAETYPAGQTVLSSMAAYGPGKNQLKSVCWLIKASDGDTAFIVRAVNSHDELVAALTLAGGLVDDLFEKCPSTRVYDARSAISAALAKAGGRS